MLSTQQLRDVKVLADLDQDQLQVLMSYVRVVHYNPLEVVVHEGAEGTSMFIVVDGELGVYRATAVGEHRLFIRKLKTGDSFGEIAVLDRGRRSATVEATREAVLAEFTCDSLEKLMRERPELACRLLCNLARYLAGDVRDLTRRLCNFIDQESALAPLR